LEAFGTAFWTVSNRCIERSRLQELLRPVRHDWDRQTGVFGALLGRVAPLGWGNLGPLYSIRSSRARASGLI